MVNIHINYYLELNKLTGRKYFAILWIKTTQYLLPQKIGMNWKTGYRMEWQMEL